MTSRRSNGMRATEEDEWCFEESASEHLDVSASEHLHVSASEHQV